MTTGTTKNTSGKGAGRSVRLADGPLREKVRELIAEGYVTRGAITKRLREIDLGTNGQRLAAAFADVVKADGAPAKPAKARSATAKVASPVTTGGKSASGTAVAKATAKRAASAKKPATPKKQTAKQKAKGAASTPLSKPMAPKKELATPAAVAARKSTKRVTKKA